MRAQKSKIKKKDLYLSYEGMGTNVEATFKIGKKFLFTLSSLSPGTNKITAEVAEVIVKYLKRKNNKEYNERRRTTKI